MSQPMQHKDNIDGLRQLADRDQPDLPPLDDARRRQLNSLRDRADDYAAQLHLMRGAYLGRRRELNGERARVRRCIEAIEKELGDE